MFDQLIIGDIHSYDDFDASVAERRIIKPKKKSIKESVPYSNITHDFSAINGEVYWEEQTLEYDFEIIADSAEELEEKKAPFLAWIMNVMNEKLHDPFIHDYHFKATFDDIEIDESEIEKAYITVKFTAYPYMIANEPKIYTFQTTNVDKVVKILNNSAHRIIPTLRTNTYMTITKGNVSYGMRAGEFTDEKFTLDVGENELAIHHTSTLDTGTLTIEFNEEML